MSFLGSIFLWALPLAAIPVAIHLLNRRRREVIGWGAMQLLMESAPRRRRIWRLDDLLLMLLRTLAIAAIILALARPQVRSGLLTGTQPGREVILVVDASLSTGRLHNGAPVFDSIKQQTVELLDRLDESDHVRLLLAASAPHWLSVDSLPAKSATKAKAAEQLAAWTPTLASADMPACVQAAMQAEPPPDVTGRLIVVVTDGVAHGWNADAGSQWQAIKQAVARSAVPTVINVVKVDGPAGDVANLSIEHLHTNRTRVSSGEPFTLTAHVRNTGAATREATSLAWEINGEPLGDSEVPLLEAGQSTEVTFEAMCDEPGAFELSCRFDVTDDLPGDNASKVVVESLEQLPILICRADADVKQTDSQPDFLRAALGQALEPEDGEDSSSVFDPTVVAVDELGEMDLTRYRCVVLDDVLPRSADALDDLTDFVYEGGGLWLVLGDNISVEEFNAQLYQEGSGLSPLAISRLAEADADEDEELFSVHPPEGSHPATLMLGDTERLDIDDVRIEKRWEFSTPNLEHVSVLLETGDGAPLAVEQLLGDGRVIVQGFPCDPRWSNLPVCQAFVPLAQEWIWYLTEPTATKHNIKAGSPIVIAPQDVQPTDEGAVLTPTGETIPLDVADSSLGGDIRYHDTTFPGSYRVTLSRPEDEEQRIPYYVRREAKESRLASLSDEQIAQLTNTGGLRFEIDPLAGPVSAVENIHYQPFWKYLLYLVVLLFVAEFIVTFLSTKSRYADVAQPEKTMVAPSHTRSDTRRESA